MTSNHKPGCLEGIISPYYDAKHFDPFAPTDWSGLVKVGGKINPDWILEAYSKGIFPWYNEKPYKWYSPHRRPILYPQSFRTTKSFKKLLNNHDYVIRLDSDFEQVIQNCAKIKRKYCEGDDVTTWITEEMMVTYKELHKLGVAHSVEVWKEFEEGSRLVGGLYGISLGKMFFGESMFSIERDTSKLALYYLCQFLIKEQLWGIDCQVYSEHLESLGADLLFKKDFLSLLFHSNTYPTLVGKWSENRS